MRAYGQFTVFTLLGLSAAYPLSVDKRCVDAMAEDAPLPEECLEAFRVPAIKKRGFTHTVTLLQARYDVPRDAPTASNGNPVIVIPHTRTSVRRDGAPDDPTDPDEHSGIINIEARRPNVDTEGRGDGKGPGTFGITWPWEAKEKGKRDGRQTEEWKWPGGEMAPPRVGDKRDDDPSWENFELMSGYDGNVVPGTTRAARIMRKIRALGY